MRRGPVLTLVFAAALLAPAGPAGAQGTTTFDGGSVTIADNTSASPYPATIAVYGVPASVIGVRATLSTLTHTFPDDLDVLLVSPNGENVTLMSDAGGTNDLQSVTLTFDDRGSLLSDAGPVPSGTYRPTNFDECPSTCFLDTYPSPAPSGPFGSRLGALVSGGANGTWSLYIVDDAAGDTGTMRAWSLTFILDTTGPTAPLLIAPPDGSAFNRSPAFDWSDLEDTATVLYGFQADTACTFSAPSIDVSGLTASAYTPPAVPADGRYCWRARGVDGFGNPGAWSATRVVTIDTVAPVASVVTNCAVTGTTGWCRSASYTFSGAASDAGTGVSSTTCTVDGVSRTCTGVTVSGEGAHTVAVRAVDNATNVATATRALGIDSRPPSVGVTTSCAQPGDAGWCRSASYTYSASASDDPSGSGLQTPAPACTVDGAAAACPGTVSTAGTHTIGATARDVSGNLASASRSLGIDAVAPSASAAAVCSVPGNAGFCRGSIDLSGTGSDPPPGSGLAAGYPTCTIGGTQTACAQTWSQQGSSVFAVTSRDRAAWQTLASRSFKIDSIPPVTTISSGPAPAVASTSATFSFTSEAGATFRCSLDGASFSACTSPKSYTALSEASHTFSVVATDVAGNLEDPPKVRGWRVDLTRPDTTITLSPNDPTNTRIGTFGFNGTETPVTFTCSIDGSAFAACSAPKSYASLSEARHTFRVRATDQAGNTDATPAAHLWTVDVTPPDTVITGPPEESRTSDPRRTFTFHSPNDRDVVRFGCKLDAAPQFTDCASPKEYAGLSHGDHRFDVRAIDPAGNVDPTPAFVKWEIDLTAPDLVITNPTAGVWQGTNTISTSGTGPAIIFGSIHVVAKARDNESAVCAFGFFVDGVQVPTDEVRASPQLDDDGYRFYDYEWTPPPGFHVLEARALNCIGLHGSVTRDTVTYA